MAEKHRIGSARSRMMIDAIATVAAKSKSLDAVAPSKH